jgi:lipid-binding SYLF domain-containing protein
LIGTGFNGGLLVISSAKGAYGGVSLEFSGFKASRTANVAHYGRSIDAAEILVSEPSPSGDAFAHAYKALAKFSQPVQPRVA